MLLIDGIRYQLWIPPTEDEFESIVKEHIKEIFGEQCIYLDKKQKLKSLSGIGSIPDGLAVILGAQPELHIVEYELSNHDVYEHIVSQVSKFINGLLNSSTRQKIARIIYDEVCGDPLLKIQVEQALQSSEIFKFSTELLDSKPILTIIIENKTEELSEALSPFSYPNIKDMKVVEFKTFTREGVGLQVHAHSFEPLYPRKFAKSIESPPTIVKDSAGERKPPIYTSLKQGEKLEIPITSPTNFKSHLFIIPRKQRSFFPGYKIPFTLETDLGELITHVSSDKAGTEIGDMKAGIYIQSKLADWYRKHPTLRIGDKVVFSILEPMKKYRLEILE